MRNDREWTELVRHTFNYHNENGDMVSLTLEFPLTVKLELEDTSSFFSQSVGAGVGTKISPSAKFISKEVYKKGGEEND